ncbi:MAG TPA: hypothetical protein VFC07_00590 [Verrucomicrobiae bacterium]|nr:hypothetical protein [Verrucomicrobiae bacterium]
MALINFLRFFLAPALILANAVGYWCLHNYFFAVVYLIMLVLWIWANPQFLVLVIKSLLGEW